MGAPRYADFMQNLAFDDDFRSEVETDPAGKLAEFDIDVPEDLPGSVTLPSKEDLQADLNDRINELETEGFFGPMPVFVEPE